MSVVEEVAHVAGAPRWGTTVLQLLLLVVVLALPCGAAAGTTEPALAIARATATAQSRVVTLEISGNFDFPNLVRLGYPFAVVVSQEGTTARLTLGGDVVVTTLATGTSLSAGPGIIAIAPHRLSVVVPPALVGARRATVRLETIIGANVRRSNSVTVTW